MNRKWKNIFIRVLLMLFFVGFTTLVAFSGSFSKMRPSSHPKVLIDHKDAHFFINQDDIEKQVLKHFSGVKVVNADELKRLEAYLERLPYIKEANTFIDSKGALYVTVTQRNPIARVLSKSGGHYYIDDQGLKFPLSKKYTAKVPILSGYIGEEYRKVDSVRTQQLLKVLEVFDFVNSDPFWQAQLAQLDFDSLGMMTMIPRMGNHRIYFGEMTDIEQKFKKLEIFYKYVLNKDGWDKYTTINLEYKHQIVCK